MKKKKELLIIILWILITLLLYFISLFILKDYLRYLFIIPLSFIFYILRLIILLPLSKKERSFKNKTIRYIIYFLACIILFFLSFTIRNNYQLPLYPYLTLPSEEFTSQNISSIEHQEDGRFIINTKNDTLKVLQLTDLHIGGSMATYKQDFEAFKTIYYDVIKKAKPDLIIITGDLVYPIILQSLTRDNRTSLVTICDFMERIGIPWAFVYGNHENEILSKYTSEELEESLTAYTYDHGGKLLYSITKPDIYGRYNNIIEVRNHDGSLNEALFLIDSNDYASKEVNDYDSIHEDQIKWYEEEVLKLQNKEGHNISSMLYFHIPIPEFKDAYEDLLNNSPDATYLFGEHREETASSKKNTHLLDTVLKLGSTKAIFCGHDHLNDIAIRYKGVDLVYGKSIDYLAYLGIDKLTSQRGGTMVTLLPDSKYEYHTFGMD